MDIGVVTIVLRHCAFLANAASGYGMGGGGAINFDETLDSAVARISACTFESNAAQATFSTLTIEDSMTRV